MTMPFRKNFGFKSEPPGSRTGDDRMSPSREYSAGVCYGPMTVVLPTNIPTDAARVRMVMGGQMKDSMYTRRRRQTESAGRADGFHQADLHHQIRSQSFQTPVQLGHVHAVRDRRPQVRVEHAAAGHGGCRTIGRKILDVDPVCRKQFRDLVDETRSIKAKQFDLDDLRGRDIRRRAPFDDDVKAARTQVPEGRLERRRLLVGNLDAEHARELAGKVHHPALQPVAPVGGNDLRYRIHDPGVVRTDEGENKVDHGGIVARRPRQVQVRALGDKEPIGSDRHLDRQPPKRETIRSIRRAFSRLGVGSGGRI